MVMAGQTHLRYCAAPLRLPLPLIPFRDFSDIFIVNVLLTLFGLSNRTSVYAALGFLLALPPAFPTLSARGAGAATDTFISL